ncbi:MAG TPA: CatB-related O-acetyltransferase [Salinivirgaceae bacterium]|nr:CatB-related O-acetyltransferase [Salinivirgaceae bacterium]
MITSKILSVGDYTYGNPNIIHDKHTNSKVKIGKFCSLAEGVTIFTGSNHNINWVTTYPLRIMLNLEGKYADGHPSTKGDVIIGNDVWIAANVTILSGVKIGDGAVVAANSVISKDVLPYSVVGGNPQRLIKMRFEQAIVR